MAGLRKPTLYRLFEGAVRASGWRALIVPPVEGFPASYQLSQEPIFVTVRVYI